MEENSSTTWQPPAKNNDTRSGIPQKPVNSHIRRTFRALSFEVHGVRRGAPAGTFSDGAKYEDPSS
jgi:hypothetical protein